MEPTVGRVVYYKSAGSADGKYPSVERAAIVTEVQNPTTVSLAVLNPTGIHFVQNATQGSGPQQWDWMPYQKGQVAQTTAPAETCSDSCEPGTDKHTAGVATGEDPRNSI